MAEDKKKEFPWNKADNDRKKMEGVYAGPEFFNPAPVPPPEAQDPQMFMCVYAGPDYYANRQPAGIMYAGEPAPPQPPESYSQDGSGKKCKWCGATGIHGKFCPNCGSPLPDEEKAE